MLNMIEGGGCQWISFIFQLFFSNCMSISVSSFCCTKLCSAWNDVGNIQRFQSALLKPPAERLLTSSTVWVVRIAWSSLVSMGKQQLPSEMLPGRLFLIIQSPLPRRLLLSPPTKFHPDIPFPYLHLLSSKKGYSTLQQYLILLPWYYFNTSLMLFSHI